MATIKLRQQPRDPTELNSNNIQNQDQRSAHRLWTLHQQEMIQAIFFDFNGVIIDDEPLQMTAYQELLGEQGIELTENDYYGALGMDDKTFVRAAYKRVGKKLTDDVLANLLAAKVVRHRQLIETELPLFPGVVTFLKAATRHYSLAVVSM
ncbi:MAG TPA: HAD family hydrolase, partial [Pyrinomonadaceae bacterium]|nr:HAD family hydrolase [Pyrinomonadaceae bacterium]